MEASWSFIDRETLFLSAMWVTGNTIGRELARSRSKRDFAEHKTEMELAVVRPGKLASAKESCLLRLEGAPALHRQRACRVAELPGLRWGLCRM
jgi:hypothetical protein